eukprot:TRINITY_DN49273_c0_g1_i1.p1 TRINITY_DN49273_c0_g1~~TRINITY_DN49273_c0_g1_i1.p1  ORF type:complete len:363 (-),score=46.52 TRINITY_DN49273_c0_g1_i1:55-1038(-)
MSSPRILLFAFLAFSQPLFARGGWCDAGISFPDFAKDNDVASIDVIVAQSELFHNNPKIGRKLGLFNLYHTALVLVQRVPTEHSTIVRNWTVEFDSTTNVLGAILPQVRNDTLLWDNDARYCLTEGILWGKEHWSKSYEVAMRITAKQATKLFTDFVLPVNASARHTKPLYQLWKIKSRDRPLSKTLIRDITCGDGVNWMMHYANTKLGVSLMPHFQYKVTEIVFHADRVEPVDTKVPAAWTDVLQNYKDMVQLVRGNASIWKKFEDIKRVFLPLKYVYDSNSETYFHVVGNRLPFFEATYQATELQGYPWAAAVPSEIEATASVVI